jgi:hypothetical protein
METLHCRKWEDSDFTEGKIEAFGRCNNVHEESSGQTRTRHRFDTGGTEFPGWNFSVACLVPATLRTARIPGDAPLL